MSFVATLNFSTIESYVPETSLAENQQKSNIKDPDEELSLSQQKYNAKKIESKKYHKMNKI